MIEIRSLTHDYNQHRALENINLNFKKNEITALVGPNGAGKTTLLKCLCGLMQPSKGEIFMDGLDVYENPRLAHTKIGYLPDFFGLYDSLTVRQHLQYAAESHDMPKDQIEPAIQKTVDQIGLGNKLNEKSAALSRGMKQRLAIGQVIIFQPDYIILDEPASGLDPEARLSLSKLFIHLKNEGMTLIVSSHILAELEEYATELVVIREGRLFSENDLDAPKYSEKDQRMSLLIETLDSPKILMEGLNAFDAELVIQEEKRGVRFPFTEDKDEQVKLLKFLMEKKHRIFRFQMQERRMQDKYFESIEK